MNEQMILKKENTPINLEHETQKHVQIHSTVAQYCVVLYTSGHTSIYILCIMCMRVQDSLGRERME